MQSVLIESPAYLKFRASLPDRPIFDNQLAVLCPASATQVLDALNQASLKPALLLAGFDLYVHAAFEAATALGVRPAGPRLPLVPCDKAAQRTALADKFPNVAQPAHVVVTQLKHLGTIVREFKFPAVLKAVDAAGGLAVYAVDNASEALHAAARIERLQNYDGRPLTNMLLEQRIMGAEFSLQGIARAGDPVLLTFCEKIIENEPDRADPTLRGFREMAHIGLPGLHAPPAFVRLAGQCMAAFGYPDGPFMIDFIRDAHGNLYFLEMGFRLSGFGLVKLVEQLTGWDWGELSFGWLLEHRWPEEPPRPQAACTGQCLLPTRDALARAERMAADGVVIERFASPPPHTNPALMADNLRHSGFNGRARMVGASPAAIQKVFQAILGHAIDVAGLQ
ncbi:MAG TPA: ATP-grasp domain-containing protein [Pirellulales bacterium]|nr:ATP-grasp domain-containing protein [Pirellulales bacterium]